MPHKQQLKWAQVNRTRWDRTRLVGASMTHLVGEAAITRVGAALEAASMVADLVDEEFRAHCRIVVTEARTLVINVDDSAQACTLRSRWLLPVREALRIRKSSKLSGEVVFAFGHEGIGFADTTGAGS